MKALRTLAAVWLLAGAVFAGEEHDLASPWSGGISAGYDSLYMFRGVNQLPDYAGYGSGIGWTALELGWAPTKADLFTATTWVAFGLNGTDYRETDVTLSYTRLWGDLALTAGYALYAVMSEGVTSNEVQVSAAYTIRLGKVSITPAVGYAFTLGPPPGGGGYIEAGTGYLGFRVDAEVPLYREVLWAEPWVATGLNFGYSAAGSLDDPQSFDGTDHLEMGLSFPLKVNETITIAPYGAYSHSWRQLVGTRRDTFWGGASVIFSF